MNRSIIPILLMAAAASAGSLTGCKSDNGAENESSALPVWIEADSAAAIHSRLLYDFPWTVDEARPVFRERYPEFSDADIDRFIEQKYIETLEIDGVLRVHRKAPRNLALLNPEISGFTGRGDEARPERIAYVDSILAWKRGLNPVGGAHQVTYRFSIAVPYDSALVGDTLRVWLPLPLDSAAVDYQKGLEILEASQPDYITAGSLSAGQPVHNSVFMTAPAPAAPGDTARFEYTGRYTAMGKYLSHDEIMAAMQPYDTDSELYRTYTAFDGPHYVRLDSLAREIVGDETNPLRQSELVFDYIQDKFPWAGAREYSTIDCIPAYVVEQGHGDCGQVTLLYISLMRSLGVPARWISGWMLHPGEVNYHDWGATYFEGVGWVPVDVSFGRYLNARDIDAKRFYNTGIDSYRMCINTGVGGPMIPAKKYVRSETVDFQAGEVECSKGNLFYPGWDSDLEIINVTPVETAQ
ncbi:MAG: hypothetical protein K2L16_04515 [Muribaculaceae bacterium]|nr:hypothetical protein [Muribaculaceae bacterium]